ncbi:MAG: AAA family ATPase [Firmicutes bacterium]|nr:AAA family ATPase [Bacillota bacterium]
MKDTIVINIIGGPGSGKTTIAAGLYAQLKRLGYDVENVPEFSNELVFEEHMSAFNDRLYMHAMQNHRLFVMNGKLDYIITDSPLLLTSIYNDFYLKDKMPASYNEMIHLAVKETHNLYHNVTYYLERNTNYNVVGRRENETDAIALDTLVLDYLHQNQISYKTISIENGVDEILEDLKKGL